MITRITGTLVRLSEQAAYVDVGPYEHEVYLPEYVRRQVQPLVGQSVTLRTLEYLEGNPQQGRLIPRLIGFLNDAELEFFELIGSVDGMGVKKTLRAMVRPVREIARAIEEQDVKALGLLPGIGPALAERIVAKLRRKMAKFALMIARDIPDQPVVERGVWQDAYEALLSLGYDSATAREKLDAVCDGRKKFASVDEIIFAIYQRERP